MAVVDAVVVLSEVITCDRVVTDPCDGHEPVHVQRCVLFGR